MKGVVAKRLPLFFCLNVKVLLKFIFVLKTVIYLLHQTNKNTNIMKIITKDERPIGKGYKGYTSFYSEDIIKETEKAFLVSLYFDSIGEIANKWLPKSKILVYEHIDNRDLIDNGKDFIKNINYGKNRNQYFINSFFTQDKGSIPNCAEISQSYKNLVDIASDNNILGVKGIDY